tara:strand:- start:424 stop:732 length:309 start_codon:yes stop_codon:yes gene_type:complete
MPTKEQIEKLVKDSGYLHSINYQSDFKLLGYMVGDLKIKVKIAIRRWSGVGYDSKRSSITMSILLEFIRISPEIQSVPPAGINSEFYGEYYNLIGAYSVKNR